MAIQMSSELGDKFKNIEKIKTLVNDNVQKNTDVIILPEVWTVGWACKYFKDSAEDIKNSNVINTLSNLAKQHQVNIIEIGRAHV